MAIWAGGFLYDGAGRGSIKAVTNNRIGFKAAFLQDENGNPSPVPESSGDGFQLKRWEGHRLIFLPQCLNYGH